jgi:hypothetical protein
MHFRIPLGHLVEDLCGRMYVLYTVFYNFRTCRKFRKI